MSELDRDHHIHDLLVEAVDRQVERGRSDLHFFLVLNASLVAGALATIQFLDKPQVAFLAFLAFAGGFGIALAGLHVSRNNKRYYHVLVAKRVLVEEKLGLNRPIPGHEGSNVAILAVSALATKEKVAQILADPDDYAGPRVRAGSSTDWSQWTLRGFACFHVIAALVFANSAAGCVASVVCA